MDGETCSKADYPEQKTGGCRLPPIRGERAVTVSNTGDYPLEIASTVASGRTAPAPSDGAAPGKRGGPLIPQRWDGGEPR